MTTGTKYKKLPNTKGKILVSDVSSCFLSEPIDVSKYGIVYGGVQKNIGPAGMVISIIREDLITDDVLEGTPTMLKFKTQADAGSLYNTPNCNGIQAMILKHYAFSSSNFFMNSTNFSTPAFGIAL